MTAGFGSPVFDYTSVDFTSFQEDVTRFAVATFPSDKWTDFNSSDVGVYLMETLAYTVDLLGYNINALALETIPTTMVVESNFRMFAGGFDFTMKSASAARTEVTLGLDPAGSYPFDVSSHLQFEAGDVIFQPDATTTVPAYVATITVPVTAGTEQVDEDIGSTDGTLGQGFDLLHGPLLDGTLIIVIGGTEYTQVQNAIEASSADTTYTISTSADGTTTVTFGDGVNGAVPPTGQPVLATYKWGGGTETNVAPGVISGISGTSDGSAVPPQILTVTNLARAADGGPKQTLDNARAAFPASLKENDRLVTLEDFAAEALKVSGVLAAKAVHGLPYGGTVPVILLLVPNGGGDPSDSLRNQVVVATRDKKMAGKKVSAQGALFVDFVFEVEVHVNRSAKATTTAANMRVALAAKYGLASANFSGRFTLQNAYLSLGAPGNVGGVDSILFKTFSVKPYAARHITRPTSGNGDITSIEVNYATIQRREWLVQVLNPDPSVFAFCKRIRVVERIVGTATAVTDTIMTDDAADFALDSLVGWDLHPNPETSTATFPIIGNSTESVSVAGGLLAVTVPGDAYVIEKADARIGKILHTTVVTTAVGATIEVNSTLSFNDGDFVRVGTTIVEIDTVLDGTHLTLVSSVSVTAGDSVDYVWRSTDESVRFVVEDGSTAFVVGDEMYVDTYPRQGDIVLRDEAFPLFDTANVNVTTVGGVK